MKTKTKGLIALIVVIVAAIYYYVTIPAINIHSTDTWGSSIISNRNSVNCETHFFMDSEILRKFVSAI